MNGNNKFLLDTNIVIGFLNGNKQIETFFHKGLINKKLFISQITRLELLGYPDITKEEELVINDFLSAVEVLPLNDKVLDNTISLRRFVKLKLPDAIIVATAIVNKLTLVSCDKELCKIPNLEAINPCFAIPIVTEESK